MEEKPSFTISTKDAFRIAVRDSSARFLIFSNVVTIIIALIEGWSLAQTIFIYFIQNVIIGFFNFLRILTAEKSSDDKGGETYGDADRAAKIALAVFFVFHYGFFHFGYFQFLKYFIRGMDIRFVVFTSLVFLACHTYSFIHNYESDRRNFDAQKVFFLPYQRIIPMHLTIMAGLILGFVLHNRIVEPLTLVFFLTLKMIVDVKMHCLEHAS